MTCDQLRTRRVVVCAAIRNPRTRSVICGARHYDRIMMEHITRSDNTEDWITHAEQGFIDQAGVFMTRKEARQVAKAAEQLSEFASYGDELRSDDIY